MTQVRIHVCAEVDGELHLRGLPLQKGEEVDVIVLTHEPADDTLLAILAHDPAWAWLHDPAEDVYTKEDVR